MGARYVNIDRETEMLLPCDLREWVAGDDLVHFVLEAVNDVDLRGIAGKERGTGSEQYPPRMMLALLVYCYAIGVFSSRRIERLTYQQVAVRYICGNHHPDHDTIATFRKRHGELFQRCFVSVLRLARELKLVHLGTVHIDGTKILADASKRMTLDAAAVEQQLELLDRQLCEDLMKQAEVADGQDSDEAFRLPRELANAAQRKAKLQAAREAIAARAAVKPAPQKPTVNLTDPDSRLMPQANGSYVQGYNAQLAVDTNGIIVGQTVCQATNDRRELAPTAMTIVAEQAEIEYIVADHGYDNQEQVTQVEAALDTTVICPPQRSAGEPSPRCTKQRAHRAALRLQRRRWANSYHGQELLYQRQTTIEPVIGTMKHTLGFRRFHVRGLEKVRAEWTLATIALNCRQLARRITRK